jgi:hypothetical protein
MEALAPAALRIKSSAWSPLIGEYQHRCARRVRGGSQPGSRISSGYPKIATVISAALPVVGRRRPGDALRFAVVTVETAEALRRDGERRLTEVQARLEPVPDHPGIDLGSLRGQSDQRGRPRPRLSAALGS